MLAARAGLACASDRLRVLKIEKLSILRLPAVEIEVKRGEALNQVRPSPYLAWWLAKTMGLLVHRVLTHQQAHLFLKRSVGDSFL
jgi:hypothetical protein